MAICFRSEEHSISISKCIFPIFANRIRVVFRFGNIWTSIQSSCIRHTSILCCRVHRVLYGHYQGIRSDTPLPRCHVIPLCRFRWIRVGE